MNKVQKAKALVMGFAVLLLMNSCVEFFSTSWGDAFKRDPKNVKVTTDNVDALLKAAKGDRDLSKAILDKIDADSPDPLKRAAIKAANQAVDIGSLFLENVNAINEAAKGKDGDAFQTLTDKILKDLEDRDIKVEDIGEKTTGILIDKVETKPVDPKVALKNAGPIEVPVFKTDTSSAGKITINPDTGKATITDTTGKTTNYDCEITDNKDITLIGAAANGGNVTVGYKINDDNSLVLSDLDHIKDLGLAENSGNSTPNSIPPLPGTPVFEEGFIDDTVTDSDLTLLVVTLVMAKAEKDAGGDLGAYLETLKDKNLETGEGALDDDEKVIAAVINTMIERGDDTNELTKMLEDFLGVN
jgi:hypothetical protein